VTEEFNIIGDIAGNFKTLKLLLERMPSSGIPFSVGDMCDRGPSSKEVFEFFKNNGLAILGNHEHLMLSEILKTGYYERGAWFGNGGRATLESFFPEMKEDWELKVLLEEEVSRFHGSSYFYDPDFDSTKSKGRLEEKLDSYIQRIDPSLLEWLKNLPLYFEREGLFVSHAPKRADYSLAQTLDLGEEVSYKTDDTIIWNRGKPRRMKEKIQVFGHNSFKKAHLYTDNLGVFAIGLDSSRGKILSGVHWPSLTIYEQIIVD